MSKTIDGENAEMGLEQVSESAARFVDALEDIEEERALEAVRETLKVIGWRVFGEQDQTRSCGVIDACIEAFDAKREDIRLRAETLDLLCRFQLIQDGAVHSQHVDTEARALLAMWDEPHRKYHTREHLLACLRELDAVKHKAKDWKAIALALWCHDAVYRVERSGVAVGDIPLATNEQRSANYCREAGVRLGWMESRSRAAARMILRTAHTGEAAGSFDEALMLDIDLAILSSTPADYDRFESQIREEHAHVPEYVFRRERAGVLRALGGETFSYRTGDFIGRNDAARANLKRAIARLEAE